MVKTMKRNEVQPGKVSVTESVQKSMSSGRLRSDGISLTAGGRLFQARAAATRNTGCQDRLREITTPGGA